MTLSPLRKDQIDPTGVYTACFAPGLTGHRWGVFWRDGVCSPCPGAVLLGQLRATGGIVVFPFPAQITWNDHRPVADSTSMKEALELQSTIPDKGPPPVRVADAPKPSPVPKPMKKVEAAHAPASKEDADGKPVIPSVQRDLAVAKAKVAARKKKPKK